MCVLYHRIANYSHTYSNFQQRVYKAVSASSVAFVNTSNQRTCKRLYASNVSNTSILKADESGTKPLIHLKETAEPWIVPSKISGLPVVHHSDFSAPQLPAGHRFPMQVFGRIYDRLVNHHRLVQPGQVHAAAELPALSQLHLVHCPTYVNQLLHGSLEPDKMRRIGFGEVSRTPILIQRTLSEVAGTLLTARLALQAGLAVCTAGGTHHAHRDCGSGFCLLNDLAVTAAVLIAERAVSRVLIVDLDVHQGDGTAAILADVPEVFTFSMHAGSNFPARKMISDYDIPLPDGTGDAEYLTILGEALPMLLARHKPDLVLYDAGVDVHEDDALGRLKLTSEGVGRRDALVLDTCLAEGVPVAGYVGGGYNPDLDFLADLHISLHRTALQMWESYFES